MRGRELLAASVVVALAGGCNFILGIEHDYEVGARHVAAGGGGAGGAEDASASSSGGASVTSSSSSSTSSSSGGGGSSGCPDTAMIDVGAFCIDATEVTNAAYAAWLATGPSVAAQPAFCAWNVDFTPASGWPASATKEPVVHVDWCDAFAYCAAAGKRLCGRIGGGAVAYDDFADPQQSAWMSACSNAGATLYPYGNGYVSGACDGKDYTHPNEAVAVGAAAVCHGAAPPHASIFDLSGNVAEWEDACAGASGAGDLCRRRGGSFKDSSAALRCDAASGLARSSADATTGFRCCGG